MALVVLVHTYTLGSHAKISKKKVALNYSYYIYESYILVVLYVYIHTIKSRWFDTKRCECYVVGYLGLTTDHLNLTGFAFHPQQLRCHSIWASTPFNICPALEKSQPRTIGCWYVAAFTNEYTYFTHLKKLLKWMFMRRHSGKKREFFTASHFYLLEQNSVYSNE